MAYLVYLWINEKKFSDIITMYLYTMFGTKKKFNTLLAVLNKNADERF